MGQIFVAVMKTNARCFLIQSNMQHMKATNRSFDLHVRHIPVPPRYYQYLLGGIFQHIIQDEIQEWPMGLQGLLLDNSTYDLHFGAKKSPGFRAGVTHIISLALFVVI